MAPITSFIRVSPRTTIPIRIFINRKAILKSIIDKSSDKDLLFESVVPSLSANHKSIVRLQKTNRIRLSNRDISNLFDSIKENLLKILFDISIEELSSRSVNSSSMNIQSKKNVLLIEAKGWKCHLLINLQNLDVMRKILSGHDVPSITKFGSNVQLLIKTSQFSSAPAPDILIEDQEESMDMDPDTKKMGLKYKYNKLNILSKGLDLYVIERPNN